MYRYSKATQRLKHGLVVGPAVLANKPLRGNERELGTHLFKNKLLQVIVTKKAATVSGPAPFQPVEQLHSVLDLGSADHAFRQRLRAEDSSEAR